MIEMIKNIFQNGGGSDLAELRNRLIELFGGANAQFCLVNVHPLKNSVYRLHFDLAGQTRSLVVKRLDPDIARRNQLVAERWLPAVGLGQLGPNLLGVAAELDGKYVWHIYDDLGHETLADHCNDVERVKAAINGVAQMHIRFAGHALLGECRLWGGDLGMSFYQSSVQDAIYGLKALLPPKVSLSYENQDLRDHLLGLLSQLLLETENRKEELSASGEPETLLHGDLWTNNVFTIPSPDGFNVRLIDWDHAAVGPVSYDLSTFLYRFPASEREWIYELYREILGMQNWPLPGLPEMNRLSETAELARIANRVIWPSIAAFEGEDWAWDELAMVAGWFDQLQPVFSA